LWRAQRSPGTRFTTRNLARKKSATRIFFDFAIAREIKSKKILLRNQSATIVAIPVIAKLQSRQALRPGV